MMEPRTPPTIRCAEHGETIATYVCGHLVRGVGLGFHAALDPETARPDAWCGACEEYRLANGGAWTEELEEALGVAILCGGCYDRARALNEQ